MMLMFVIRDSEVCESKMTESGDQAKGVPVIAVDGRTDAPSPVSSLLSSIVINDVADMMLWRFVLMPKI